MISGIADRHGWLGCSPIWTSSQFSMTLFPTFVAVYRAITRRYVVFQMSQAFVAYPHRPMTLHSPTENSLAGVKSTQDLERQFTGPKRGN
ncbi:hypothetical protein TNCV_4361951 [Trichonephila clavipes]|nr:hypothetical protein TNCV_4361951 [Trichonephila clavipes]